MSEPDTLDIAHIEWRWPAIEASGFGGFADMRLPVYRRLQSDNWVPSIETEFAISVLSGDGKALTVIEGSGEFIVAAEKKLAAEVDEFAAGYFALPPEARAEKLAALAKRARPFPAVLFRLRDLQRGLKVMIPRTGGDRALLDLAEHVAQLYVLRPEERARRRRQPDEKLLQTLPQWRDAAKRLWSKYPAVAALEPALMRSLTTKQVRETREYRSRTASRSRSHASGLFNVVGELLGTVLSHRWAVALVLLVGVRGCSALSNSSSVYTPARSGGYYSEPPASYYNGQSSSLPRTYSDMTPEQQEHLRRALEMIRAKQSGTRNR